MNTRSQRNAAHFSGLKSSKLLRFLAPLLILSVLAAALVYAGHKQTLAQQAAGGYHTYYVSRNGNNADGLSWATAWNELNQINWSIIQPGDTILLDGGSSQMQYSHVLTIGKSGASGAPITIERATDAGHNGTVILF